MTRYLSNTVNGKPQINSIATFCDALQCRNPLTLSSFEQFLSECESLVRTEGSPSQEAFNNVRGRWYEWLLALGSLNYYFEQYSMGKKSAILVNLPNVSSFDYMRLYEPSTYQFIKDLRKKTAQFGANLVSSNPDFAIIRPSLFEVINLDSIDEKLINWVDDQYKFFIETQNIRTLIGFVSAKTSLRPDRRLQMSHEGGIVKSFHQHLKTRIWDVDAPKMMYYGVSISASTADHNALKTIASHSILTVNSEPERAVNKLYSINSGSDLRKFLSEIN